ncbi:hypothetical protein FB565_006737 [Actinoplanes lutulentus]|uniref:Uncharacterized protein n=1 Tax=Actinoplanes lutulentus TaxID=1287878 RepID=A0A327Z4B7_9ACTN|nr:hypothetical protein [Actinoplanes lutulentus]MBB2946969.1 hypothetical protein [Actinoplanes lutulentus]RAK30471.1 hypothetical protein B0I29_116130 [Actinoplanes lutulentus]
MRDHFSDYWLLYAFVLFSGLLTGALYVQNDWEKKRFESSCRDRGGHVESQSRSYLVSAFDGNNRSYTYTATSTTYWCRSADGTTLATRKD